VSFSKVFINFIFVCNKGVSCKGWECIGYFKEYKCLKMTSKDSASGQILVYELGDKKKSLVALRDQIVDMVSR